jgi:hypothetical protein
MMEKPKKATRGRSAACAGKLNPTAKSAAISVAAFV